MKKTTMILLVAAAIVLTSCFKNGHASSVFSLGTTFEMSETDTGQYIKDSLMYSPGNKSHSSSPNLQVSIKVIRADSSFQ